MSSVRGLSLVVRRGSLRSYLQGRPRLNLCLPDGRWEASPYPTSSRFLSSQRLSPEAK